MTTIKNAPISDKEVILLREKFISEYSSKMGWNPKSLTAEQILEITQQKGYKTPGLMLS
jgi:hypothetical protein